MASQITTHRSAHRLGLVGSLRSSKPSLHLMKNRMTPPTRRNRSSAVHPTAFLSWLGRLVGKPAEMLHESANIPQEKWLPDWSTPISLDPSASLTTFAASLIVEDLDDCDPVFHLAFVSASTGAVTPWAPVAKGKKWRHTDMNEKDAAQGGSLISKACQLQGTLDIPTDFGPVGALLVRLTWPTRNKTDDASAYVESLVLQNPAGNGNEASSTVIPIHSYIFEQQGTRVFFSAQSYTTQTTPQALLPYRAADLEVTQGLRTSLGQDGAEAPRPPFQAWHRVYQFDVYNDLGGDPQKEDYQRPTLGGDKLPYPRRIRTGRQLVAATVDGQSALVEAKPASDQPYLPKNETFTPIRNQGFNGNVFKNVALSAINVIATVGRNGVNFDSFHEVKSWFTQEPAPSMEATPGAAAITARKHPGFKWPAPAVYNGRPDMWRSDKEFGRQVLAGQNPVTVTAVKSLDGTAFSSKNVPPELTGSISLEELVAAAQANPASCRIFQQNYSSILVDYVEKVASAHDNRVLSGARCLLYANAHGELLPVAVELRRSADAAPEVYTPLDGPAPWMLAKVFVTTNDSAFHQVVSHWLRTHASVEPFIIASRRQLSLAHPINRLLQKHTTYTLQINSLARVALVNAGGIIERTFSPGRYSMEIGAKVYEATWRFNTQALPNDLVSRGVAVQDPKAPAGVRLVDSLGDYPFAEDALQLWTVLEGWISDYVNLYYSTDEEVLKDREVVGWWEDIQNEGHPDIKEGWPVLDGRTSLARILTTIIYIASAHHAAVNFGQYDFSGLLLNRSSKIRKSFPVAGSEEYKLLAAGADYEEIEKIVLSYLAGPVDYATVLAVIEVLSAHDDHEAYLGNTDPWVLDAPAVERYTRFAQDLAALEESIKERNKDPELKNRNGDYVVPYTLLIPSSGGGVTRRGVPNSISI